MEKHKEQEIINFINDENTDLYLIEEILDLDLYNNMTPAIETAIKKRNPLLLEIKLAMKNWDEDNIIGWIKNTNLPSELFSEIFHYALATDRLSEALAVEMLKIEPSYIYYIKNQTPKLCTVVLQQELRSYFKIPFEYIKIQTPELCLLGVKQHPCALQFVKEQTPEICIEAIKGDFMTLYFVKDQTFEVCMEAAKQNKDAICLIRNPEMKEKVVKALNKNLDKLIFTASKRISLNKQQNTQFKDVDHDKYRI